jgi:chromosome segregation ATPase
MDAVNRGGAIVGFGGGGTYGSPEHITRLESQLAAAHKEIERLRMRLKQCDERNRATEAKANEQGGLLLRESTRHERFATLIKAAEAENKRLAKRLAQTDRRTADDIRQLELTISSMEEECHSLRIERDTMEEQLMRERDRASQHEFAAKRQTMDHGALVKALSVTKEEKEIETTRRLAVETNLAAARDDIATHLARMHRMDQDIAQLRATLSQTDTTAGTRLTEVVDQLEDERRRHRHAKSTLKSLQENQASADEHWRQKIEALKQEIDSAAASGDWQRSKLLGILLQKQGEAYADRDEIGRATAC